MRNHRITVPFVFSVMVVALAGCNWNSADERERQEKTREEVAKATERAKPALEDAGRKIGAAAKEAADEAQAAAEGVKQGWDRGGHHLVNINVATESELTELPGIGPRDARRIVNGRPYQDKHDVVVKGAISETDYEKIRDRISSK